jgi:hypothetical protein
MQVFIIGSQRKELKHGRLFGKLLKAADIHSVYFLLFSFPVALILLKG